MNITNFVGIAGSIFSSVSFLPQVIKLWKTKSAKDLSMMTLLFLILNVSTWLTYGVLIDDLPIIIGVSVKDGDHRIFWWLGTNAIFLLIIQPGYAHQQVVYIRFFVNDDKDYKNTKPT